MRRPGDFLAALRTLSECIERDGDSLQTWTNLSLVFEAMNDLSRSDLCRGIARSLSRAPLPRMQARG